jgi:hypothetical protein
MGVSITSGHRLALLVLMSPREFNSFEAGCQAWLENR